MRPAVWVVPWVSRVPGIPVLILTCMLSMGNLPAQEQNIRDLGFLIGAWEVREDNQEKAWWEKSKRIGRYILDSTFIELKAKAVSSSGKERMYSWYIHYNFKKNRFEMVSLFSNWHKFQFDILHWDPESRKLTIRNGTDPNSNDYHQRYGELIFDEDYNEYIWKGQNKYGDPNKPSIWNYVEKGKRTQ